MTFSIYNFLIVEDDLVLVIPNWPHCCNPYWQSCYSYFISFYFPTRFPKMIFIFSGKSIWILASCIWSCLTKQTQGHAAISNIRFFFFANSSLFECYPKRSYTWTQLIVLENSIDIWIDPSFMCFHNFAMIHK